MVLLAFAITSCGPDPVLERFGVDLADPVRAELAGRIVEMEREAVIREAERMLDEPPRTVTKYPASRSLGGPNDYYSEGTYWWPDPENPDGPYIRRDGLTNPDNFDAHRLAVERLARITGTLTSAYLLTGDSTFSKAVVPHLRAWFLDPDTRMNPNMLYAQAIQGVVPGRDVGIIDTAHLLDAALSILHLEREKRLPSDVADGLRAWFGAYLEWLTTHPQGISEGERLNNHATWWWIQVAAYARLVGDETVLEKGRNWFMNDYLGQQMDPDGGFPRETARTKPFAYSQFNLEGGAMLAVLLSSPECNLWEAEREDGRSLALGMGALLPSMGDKSLWPLAPDVSGWDDQPNAHLFPALAALAYGEADGIEIWASTRRDQETMENLRNRPSKNLLLWLGLVPAALDRSPWEATYANPILPGFNPDPSIVRVGEVFYLTTSTFEWFPGLPIYRSRDLVNWELIGHAIHRTDQLDYGQVTNSRGIFAPSLKHHDGRFYLATRLIGTPGKKGSFVVTAEDPAGPWSDPIWLDDAPGIDPSLFFDDDGRSYITGNLRPPDAEWPRHRIIWLQEFDFETEQFLGEPVVLVDAADYHMSGTLDGGYERGVNNFEGPHLYKKNGFYYLVLAHGGTEEFHAVSIFRSREITGPYESNPENPILTHRDLPYSHPITSVGHASLIQRPAGDWWLVSHGKRPVEPLTEPYQTMSYPLGRETMLSPVDWSGDWPVVNPQGSVGRAMPRHRLPEGVDSAPDAPGYRDDFAGNSLDLGWTFIREPETVWHELDPDAGVLRMRARPVRLEEPGNPSFLGRRMEQTEFTAMALLTVDEPQEGMAAGMTLFREQHRYLAVALAHGAGRDRVVVLEKNGETAPERVLAATDLPSGMAGAPIRLRVTGERNRYRFEFARADEAGGSQSDASTWTVAADSVDGGFLGMDIGGGRFTGSFIGLYATSPEGNRAPTVSVDVFEVTWRK